MTLRIEEIGDKTGVVLTREMLAHLGVSDTVDVAIEQNRIVISAPTPEPEDRVLALIHKWQQEYGLPPRPDGSTGHVPLVDLFAEWAAEEANMTAEEIEAEQKLWEDIERNREPVRI